MKKLSTIALIAFAFLLAAVPGSKGIEQAIKLCAKLLDSALTAHKAGRSEESVRDLLGMVILVVTPMTKPGG